jgi:hypothetical protein
LAYIFAVIQVDPHPRNPFEAQAQVYVVHSNRRVIISPDCSFAKRFD